MRTNKRLMNILPRVTAIVLAMLFAVVNLNFTQRGGAGLSLSNHFRPSPGHA